MKQAFTDSRLHEKSFKVFSATPGSDIEFELGCRLCGQVSEVTYTVPAPQMGSIKLLYACPKCQHSGMLVLDPIQES